MSSDFPVIIEAAINGTTPRERNANVPRSPAEIAADALACLAAGATIVHNHNDDPVIDMVTAAHEAQPYIDAWGPVLEKAPDAFLYPTMTGGGPHTTIAKRYGHIPELARAGVLTMGIVDPGSLNIGGLDADGSPAPNETVYLNSSADSRYMVDVCGEIGVPINFSIFDGSFMRAAVAYVASGRVPHGGLIKIFFGSPAAPFGLPASEAALLAYLDVLGDCPLPWSVGLPGGDLLETSVARRALELGGHLRVGLEDHAGPGEPTNVELVERAVALAAELGRPVASPQQALAAMRVS